LFWKDQFITGKKLSIIGLKGGGVAQGYNPGMAWGTHVAGKYYQMDLWLGFKERDRINAMISAGHDPNNDGPDGIVNSGDDTLIYINPPTP